MAQIQFSLIKKIKIGRPEQSLTPTLLRPVTFHFYLRPYPPQGGYRRCITREGYHLLSKRKIEGTSLKLS